MQIRIYFGFKNSKFCPPKNETKINVVYMTFPVEFRLVEKIYTTSPFPITPNIAIIIYRTGLTTP